MKVTLQSVVKCCMAAVMLSPFGTVLGNDNGPTTALRVPTVGTSYTLDGKLNETFWKNVPEQSGFHVMDSRGNQREVDATTSFRLVRSGETLLVGIVCQQRQEDLTFLATQRNQTAVCSDDSVEIFLTTGDSDGHYQFSVNTKGYLFDRWVAHGPAGEPKLWSGAWEAAVQVEPTQWSVEAAIPLAALNHTTANSQPWRLNIARTMARARIYQSWSEVNRSFGEWEKHLPITFADEVKLPSVPCELALPTLYPGTHHDEAVISIPVEAGRTYTLKSSLREWKPGALPPRELLAQRLMGEGGKLRFPLEMKVPPGDQLSELVFEVIDEENSQTVALLCHTFYPPKLLEATMPWSVWFDADEEIQLTASINATAEGKKKGKLRLALINSEGKTVQENVLHLSSKDTYLFRLPLLKLSPDLYEVEITLHSEDAGQGRWAKRFQLVRGPFSEGSPSPKQTAHSTDPTLSIRPQQ